MKELVVLVHYQACPYRVHQFEDARQEKDHPDQKGAETPGFRRQLQDFLSVFFCNVFCHGAGIFFCRLAFTHVLYLV